MVESTGLNMPAFLRTSVPFGTTVRTQPVVAAPRRVLLQRTTASGALLSVTEAQGIRQLHLGTTVQSEVCVSNAGELETALVEEWTQLIVALAYGWVAERREIAAEGRRALLLGCGGGVIARALLPLLAVHIVELEPEVFEAAQSHFGLKLGERCTSDVGCAVAWLERQVPLAARAFEIVIVDCFTADGLAGGVADGSMLARLADVVGDGGLCVVNLHTCPGKSLEERTEADWEGARCAMSRLRARFACVYALPARSCQNVLAVCHQGATRSPTCWQALVEAGLRHGAAAACPDIRSTAIHAH